MWLKCLSVSVKVWTAAIAVLGIAAFASAPALANDSSAELSTGGLCFLQNPSVAMRSEQLFVSTTEIGVAYHFYNNTDRPVTSLVAFPMPDITIDNPDENISIPAYDSANFLAFTTTVDSRRVATRLEQKAFAKGIDQTALLRRLGIPLAPQLQAARDALTAVPQDKWQQLVEHRRGAIAKA
jgi:hypothetical protein